MIQLSAHIHSLSITFLQNFVSGVNMSSSYQIIVNAYEDYFNFLLRISVFICPQ